MNATVLPFRETPSAGRPYSVKQLVEQEQSFFAIQTAKLNKLFDKSGQREEWRNDFLGAFENFIAEQEAELNRAAEEDREDWSDRETGRAVFAGLNSLVTL